jgi:hypothetical protein
MSSKPYPDIMMPRIEACISYILILRGSTIKDQKPDGVTLSTFYRDMKDLHYFLTDTHWMLTYMRLDSDLFIFAANLAIDEFIDELEDSEVFKNKVRARVTSCLT